MEGKKEKKILYEYTIYKVIKAAAVLYSKRSNAF